MSDEPHHLLSVTGRVFALIGSIVVPRKHAIGHRVLLRAVAADAGPLNLSTHWRYKPGDLRKVAAYLTWLATHERATFGVTRDARRHVEHVYDFLGTSAVDRLAGLVDG